MAVKPSWKDNNVIFFDRGMLHSVIQLSASVLLLVPPHINTILTYQYKSIFTVWLVFTVWLDINRKKETLKHIEHRLKITIVWSADVTRTVGCLYGIISEDGWKKGKIINLYADRQTSLSAFLFEA